MATLVDDLIALLIMVIFVIIIWAGFKKKPVKEVFEDLKEIFGGGDSENDKE